MKVGIIGCGNMGEALLKGLIARGYTSRRNIFCFDKDRKKLNSLRRKFGVCLASSNSEVFKRCGAIILAVKPKDVPAALADAVPPLKGKLLISVCAGITTKKLQKHLGKVAVVRVMPNMPALIAEGVSTVSVGRYATAKDKRLAVSIFSCIGEAIEVKEQLMDAVTAISGSGPAYFFYLTESLIKTAQKLGIPEHIAKKLAIKTALGSALLMNQSRESPQILRAKVTSRGGTTEAAFNVFRKKGIDRILSLAFQAAAKRSKQL